MLNKLRFESSFISYENLKNIIGYLTGFDPLGLPISNSKYRTFLKRSKSPPYNVSAFPTVLYYQNGKYKFPYNHPQKKDALIEFLDNPTEKSLAASWAENPESVSNHLTNETFDAFISNHENVMIFFHAMYANDLCADIMKG